MINFKQSISKEFNCAEHEYEYVSPKLSSSATG